MTTKFTPGPWRYNIATNGEIVSINERGPDTTVVEADAANPHNAHLIAAAPDLYAALKEIMDGRAMDSDLREQCRSALAKARGERQ